MPWKERCLEKVLPLGWEPVDGLKSSSNVSDAEAAPPSFGEAFRFWLKLGFISFGGPAGQIAIMHREVVEQKKWIGEASFLRALNYCMLLPGPEAQQLATYIGWRLHGVRGGLVAGGLFVLPAALILWAISWIYMTHGQVGWVLAIFEGLRPVVVAIILAALVRIAKKTLKTPVLWAVAMLALVLLGVGLSYPWVILGVALIGAVIHRVRPDWLGKGAQVAAPEQRPLSDRALVRHSVLVIFVGLAVWWLPLLACGAALGWESVWFAMGTFFSKVAMVTFGGAYAVLPYVAEHTVRDLGWLSAGQMLDGMALAETTPGPLIMVLQFAGFVAAWQQPSPLSPLGAASFGAAVTTWATFAPCFLWIFLGAPWIERLGRVPSLNAVLTAITAAVVGVMASLLVWFGLQVLFPAGSPDLWNIAVALAGLFLLVRFQWSTLVLVGVGAVLGVGRYMILAG
jgi:chromate transporter